MFVFCRGCLFLSFLIKILITTLFSIRYPVDRLVMACFSGAYSSLFQKIEDRVTPIVPYFLYADSARRVIFRRSHWNAALFLCFGWVSARKSPTNRCAVQAAKWFSEKIPRPQSISLLYPALPFGYLSPSPGARYLHE